MTQEALKLALDALENHTAIKHPQQIYYRDQAITAIKEALAQPEQEPFGYFKAEPFGWTDCAESDVGAIALYQTPPRRTEQEPVERYPSSWAKVTLMVSSKGEMHAIGGDQELGEGDMPYIGLDRIKERLKDTPPQRTWVGLTNEEIDEWTPEIHSIIQTIEAKLKQKNA